MKPHFHRVPSQLEKSFSVRHDLSSNFGTLWHYHPELELHHVIRGEGVRFIGDNIENFSSGEVLLLGANLPHTWRCNEKYFENNPNNEVEAMVMHFLPECLGAEFVHLPENYLLPKLYEKAKKGMNFYGETRERISALMLESAHTSGLKRIILFLNLLMIMAESEQYIPITSSYAFYKSNESDIIRLNKIYAYALANYKDNISLAEMAALSNLSVTSFCRYFKIMTKKTFYDFLVEIRISHACRMLVEDQLSTEAICFNCGFNTVSNFYRHFKKVTKITPLEYRRKYLNQINA